MTSTRSSHEARKNSEFRKAFFWQLKQSRLVTVIYTLVLAAVVPGLLLLEAVSSYEMYKDPSQMIGMTPEEALSSFSSSMASSLNGHVLGSLIPVTLAFIIGYCVMAFGYMHGRRSVDLFHALPLRRRPLLLGSFAAGLVDLYLPLLLTYALTQCVSLGYHLTEPFGPAFIWQGFLLVILLSTAVYTSTMFFCVCSGTLLDAAISILAINVGWPILCLCVNYLITLTLPGYAYSLNVTLGTALAPYLAIFYPFGSYFFSGMMGSIGPGTEYSVGTYDVDLIFVIWWVIVALVFFFGSIIYYSRRKSECAEDHFSAPVIRGILRFLVSAAGGLGVGLITGSLLDSNLAFLIALVLGSFVAHLLGQLVWTHSLKGFWKTIPAYALMLCCTGGFMAALYTGGLGFVTRVPAADDVQSVGSFTPTHAIDSSKESFFADSTAIQLTDTMQENNDVIAPEFTELEDIKTFCNYHIAITDLFPGPYLPFGHGDSNEMTEFVYHLKNGGDVSRRYDLSLSEDTKDVLDREAAVIKLDAFTRYNLFSQLSKEQFTSFGIFFGSDNGEYNANPAAADLTPEQWEEIWNTFQEELNSPAFHVDVDFSQRDEDLLAFDEAFTAEDDTAETGTKAAPIPAALPKNRSQAEALFSNLDYTITLDYLPIDALDLETQALIRNHETVFDVAYAYSATYLTVPECCTKTRELMFNYSYGLGELVDYSEMGDEE